MRTASIRAFVNACAHRFACLVADANGTTKRFTCPYHAWTCDIAGALVRAPFMEMKPEFDLAKHRLRALPVDNWEGFIYVTLAWRRMMIDFCVFPNHRVTLMPDYLWYISVQPFGADRMQATWGLAVPPEVLDDVAGESYNEWLDRFRKYLEVANGEDKALVEALYRGSSSPLLPAGTYHPVERNLWQFTRYLAGACRT